MTDTMISNTILKRKMQAHEQYKTLCISTGDITEPDMDKLTLTAGLTGMNMIMVRDTGLFLKLYDDECYMTDMIDNLTTETQQIINTAIAAGYRMIEVDCDAEALTDREF
jgi:hypothetical protein